MGTFSVGGLSTGLDTKSIVDQLMSIESRPKIRLEWQHSLWESRKKTWGDLNTRLLSLQQFANKLTAPSLWTSSGATGGGTAASATSSAPGTVGATLTGASPAASSYFVEVSQLAQGEISQSTGTLGPPTSGVRTTGAFLEGASNGMEQNDRLRTLRTQSGTNLNVDNGSTFTMSWTVNGVAQSADFVVGTDGDRLRHLNDWAAATIGGGATAAVTANGEIEITTAPGTANELQSLTFSVTQQDGTAQPLFDSEAAASSTQTVAATDGAVLADETLFVDVGGTVTSVQVFAGDDMAAIAARITAAGAGVTATESGGVIEVRSNATGLSSAFSITSSAGLAAQLGFVETQAAQDAQFTVDGAAYTNESNTAVAGAIADVSLDLLALTGGPVEVTVDPGTGGTGGPTDAWIGDATDKIRDFVNQYNSVLDFIDSKTDEQRVLRPSNLGEYLQAPMSRNVRFSSVGFDLRRAVSDAVAGLPAGARMLADIGIDSSYQIGAGKGGRLEIDDAALEQALRDDYTKVQAVFQQVGAGPGITGDDGIARRVNELVSQLRVGGKVDSAMQGASNQMSQLQDSIDRMDDRLVRKREYFDRMFASLETQIGRMNSQMGWLQGQFSQMSAGMPF